MTTTPDTPFDPDGTPEDAFDSADHHTNWDQVEQLVDRYAAVGEGDKAAAKALYRELAGGA